MIYENTRLNPTSIESLPYGGRIGLGYSSPAGGGRKGARKITLIIIHCSAVRPDQTSSAKQIDTWHKARGWSGIGYHYVVRRDGTIEPGRPEWQVGAHCLHHNTHSIGICLEGGLDSYGNPADTRTVAQKNTLLTFLPSLLAKYPQAIIVGHHDLDPTKSCPCFDVVKEYGKLP